MSTRFRLGFRSAFFALLALGAPSSAYAQREFELPVTCNFLQLADRKIPCGSMRVAYLKSYRGIGSFGPMPPPSDIMVIVKAGQAAAEFVGNAIRRDHGTLVWLGLNRMAIPRTDGGNPMTAVEGDCDFSLGGERIWSTIVCTAEDLDSVRFSVSLRLTGRPKEIPFGTPLYQ